MSIYTEFMNDPFHCVADYATNFFYLLPAHTPPPVINTFSHAHFRRYMVIEVIRSLTRTPSRPQRRNPPPNSAPSYEIQWNKIHESCSSSVSCPAVCALQ